MKIRKYFLLFCYFLLISKSFNARCQDSETTNPVEKSLTATPNPQNPQETTPTSTAENISRFKSNTAWGQLNIVVRNHQDNFKVEVDSNTSATGWNLKETKTNRTLSKGGINSAHQFQFLVNQAFQGTFRLTVFLNVDREQVPVGIGLSSSQPTNTEISTPEVLDDFQENPNHPFNTTVHTLYGKAMEDFSNNDKHSAFEHLKKAEELDPSQPQVQALLKKIISNARKNSEDLLNQAQVALKRGNKMEALAKVTDYLEQNPDNEKALELKELIEKNDHFGRFKMKKQKTKKEISTPTIQKMKTPLPNNEEKKAQADQTYNLGLDSYRKSDYATAKKYWEQTLQLQPTHPQAQRNLERLKNEHPDLPKQ